MTNLCWIVDFIWQFTSDTYHSLRYRTSNIIFKVKWIFQTQVISRSYTHADYLELVRRHLYEEEKKLWFFFLFLLREILRYKIVNLQICQVFVIWLLLFLFSNQLESCRCNTCSYFYCLQLVGTCLQAVAHKYAQTTAKQIIYLWKFLSTSLCTGPDLIWP